MKKQSSVKTKRGPACGAVKTTEPRVRCVIYARSAAPGSNIAEQIEECARVVAQHHQVGWALDHVFIDRVASGDRINHPGFRRMIRKAKAAAFSIIVVRSADRIARDRHLLSQTVAAFQALGVTVFLAGEGRAISANPPDSVFNAMAAAFGELEPEEKAERERTSAHVKKIFGLD